MSHPHRIRHTSHTSRGPIGSCTEGPSGRARMAYPHPMRHTPHTFRGVILGAPPKALAACPAW
eukprot:2214988-Pyramimonas_sp.AAC.1